MGWLLVVKRGMDGIEWGVVEEARALMCVFFVFFVSIVSRARAISGSGRPLT